MYNTWLTQWNQLQRQCWLVVELFYVTESALSPNSVLFRQNQRVGVNWFDVYQKTERRQKTYNVGTNIDKAHKN